MAEQYEIIGAVPMQEIDAAGRLRDTMTATAVTIPHQVTFTVSVPKGDGWRAALLAAAAEEAAELESLFDG